MNARPLEPFAGDPAPESFVQGFRRLARKFGPYLLIEAAMPGGTLVALLLYLYRTRRGA